MEKAQGGTTCHRFEAFLPGSALDGPLPKSEETLLRSRKVGVVKADRVAVDIAGQAGKTARMFYIDNLRLLFTFLVILHHVCLTYAAHNGWYFYEYLHDPFTNLVLNILMAVNRTWVLGCFFMISGYFTPGALDKKGTWNFTKDRFVRIGIPLVLFSFLVRPSIIYMMNRDALSRQYNYLENILLMKNVAPGPAWFLEVLLVFSLVYALWRGVRRMVHAGEPAQRPFPGNRTILLSIIALTVFTFMLRIFLPTEKEIFHLRLGNYGEYVAFFGAGVLAYRHQWLDKITDAIGTRWTIITAAAVCVYACFVIFAWSSNTSLSFLRGGLSVKTLIVTCVGTFIAVGSNISLVHLFRKYLNHQPGVIRAMARDAYAVFIFHAPIIVTVSYFLQGRALLHPFVKFASVYVFGIALCFLTCRYVIRRLPYAQKIL
jgi:glucan biosynthesis protein C